MRILLDSNILISGLISPSGPPGTLLHQWRAGRFVLLSSLGQIEEMQRVLTRPKVAARLHPRMTESLLSDLRSTAVLVTVLPELTLSSDPDDNLILAIAIGGRADLIVSGDLSGMLDLEEVRGIPVISAREAIERLARGE